MHNVTEIQSNSRGLLDFITWNKAVQWCSGQEQEVLMNICILPQNFEKDKAV